VSISSKREVVDIFFRGSLVFRHDPKGEMTDFFETRGHWIDEMERMARDITPLLIRHSESKAIRRVVSREMSRAVKYLD
jgi:hypothetical protein